MAACVMARLVGEVVFEVRAQGPAPSKDYFSLQVTHTEVIWRWWKISLRPDSRNMRPGEVRESHREFLDDRRLQSQVLTVFGPPVLQYSRCLCQGQYDYLQRLPDSLLLLITAHLELEDVARLARTCRRFKQVFSGVEFSQGSVQDTRVLHSNLHTPRIHGARCVYRSIALLEQLCSSEQFWEQTVRLHCDTVTPGMEDLARDVGWRRVFFTNKLQLQKEIRRRREGNKHTHTHGRFTEQHV